MRHKRTALAIAGSVVSIIMGASAVSGSYELRGGNHGCNPEEGTFFEDHFFESGDNVSIGLSFKRGTKIPPATPDEEILGSINISTGDEGDTGASCGAIVGAWKEVSSNLGDGDDSVRLNAKGLEDEPGQRPYKPIPKSIDAVLIGGKGADKIHGHKGFDDVKGGGGADVIKLDDGLKDVVDCGNGRDKADVDSKDETTSCETKT